MLQALQSFCILAGNKSTMIIIVSKRTITERANHVDCKVLWRAPFTSMKRILPCYYEKAGEAVLFIYLCQKASSIMFIFSLRYIIIVVITIFHIFHTKLQVLGWSFLHIISSWLLLSARSLRKNLYHYCEMNIILVSMKLCKGGFNSWRRHNCNVYACPSISIIVVHNNEKTPMLSFCIPHVDTLSSAFHSDCLGNILNSMRIMISSKQL